MELPDSLTNLLVGTVGYGACIHYDNLRVQRVFHFLERVAAQPLTYCGTIGLIAPAPECVDEELRHFSPSSTPDPWPPHLRPASFYDYGAVEQARRRCEPESA